MEESNHLASTAQFNAVCFTGRHAEHLPKCDWRDSNSHAQKGPTLSTWCVVPKLRHSRIDSASWIRTSSIPGFKPRWSASCLSRCLIAGERFERSACLGLSKTGLPVAYPAVTIDPEYPRKDSNFHFSRSERDDSCQLVYVGVSALDEI